jgi:hypothetical protein
LSSLPDKLALSLNAKLACVLLARSNAANGVADFRQPR